MLRFMGCRMGSSPRIRGEYVLLNKNEVVYGIIPANTGRIYAYLGVVPQSRDHPREYGENVEIQQRERMITGSSPRIRGECDVIIAFHPVAGIIPANTGRISRNTNEAGNSRDHPREYGENLVFLLRRLRAMGSSPRIRGESCRWPSTIAAWGIIPANTGRIQKVS